MHQLSERVYRAQRTERQHDRAGLGKPAGRGDQRYRYSGCEHDPSVPEAGRCGVELADCPCV